MKIICKILFTAAKIAPLLTAIAASLAVGYGIVNVDKQIDTMSEIKAIELFNEYSNRVDKDTLFYEGNRFIDSNKNVELEKLPIRYRLFANYSLFIAESIYNLVGDKKAWQKTIVYIIKEHIKFYSKNGSIDESLSEDFRKFYNNYCEQNK